MIEQKYTELMNQEIDGVNTPSESEELQRFLERSPEARQYYTELQGVTRALSLTGRIEPPAGLNRQILDSIEPKARKVKTPFFDGLRARFRPKYAYTFAVGLIAGICLYALFNGFSSSGNRLNKDDLYGTIAFESVKGRPLSSIPVEINLDGISGTAVFTSFDEALIAQITMRSEHPTDLLLDYTDGLSFQVFKTLVSTDHDLQTENGTLRITNGEVSDYVIVFKDTAKTPQEVTLKVVSSGKLLFEKTIEPGRK